MKTGRPTKYSFELAEKICHRVATSSDGLTKICGEFDVDHATVSRWKQNNLEFRDMYARAKEEQVELLVEEILSISDESKNDTLTVEGKETANHEWISRSRLRVDSRKWLAAKLLPKKYGDKLDIEHKVVKLGKELADESYSD